MNINNFLLASTLALMSNVANAELIATDLNVIGDGLATLDSQSGLEWLDLSQTDNQSYASVQSQLNTTYSGWRFPTELEVANLFKNTFGKAEDIYSREDSELFIAGMNFVTMMGETYFDQSYLYSRGVYKSNEGNYLWAGVQPIKDSAYDIVNIYFDKYVTSINSENHTRGVFLVSDGGTTLSSINNPELNINNDNAPINNGSANVPLSSSFTLMALALAGIRRKYK